MKSSGTRAGEREKVTCLRRYNAQIVGKEIRKAGEIIQRCTRHTKSQPRTNSTGKQSLCQPTDRKEEDFWCSELMQTIIIFFSPFYSVKKFYAVRLFL